MIKTLLKIAVAVAAVFSLNSCDMEMYGTYTFSHSIVYSHLSEGQEGYDKNHIEATSEALEKYFGELELDEPMSFTGTHYEAAQYGSDFLSDIFEKFEADKAYIVSLLTDVEKVTYMMNMSGNKSNVTIGYFIWAHERDESGEEGESGQPGTETTTLL